MVKAKRTPKAEKELQDPNLLTKGRRGSKKSKKAVSKKAANPDKPLYRKGEKGIHRMEMMLSGNEVRIPYKTIRIGEGHLIFTV